MNGFEQRFLTHFIVVPLNYLVIVLKRVFRGYGFAHAMNNSFIYNVCNVDCTLINLLLWLRNAFVVHPWATIEDSLRLRIDILSTVQERGT